MFLAIAEILLAVAVVWFVATQIVIPAATGTKAFPLFRGGKKAAIKDMIAEEKDLIEEEELMKQLHELKEKEERKEEESK